MEKIELNEPRVLNDIVFSDEKSKSKLENIISGRYPFPAFNKVGILIYGVWGTGKTALARLIPDLMEKAKIGEDANWEFNYCKKGGNGSLLLDKLEARTQTVSFNRTGFHYIILDEVDNLTDGTQLHLKALMNRKDVIWIMTTNYIGNIDKGVINRSHLIEMNAASTGDWLPACHKVLKQFGLRLPDAALEPVISSCDGSARDILNAMIEIGVEKSSS